METETRTIAGADLRPGHKLIDWKGDRHLVCLVTAPNAEGVLQVTTSHKRQRTTSPMGALAAVQVTR